MANPTATEHKRRGGVVVVVVVVVRHFVERDQKTNYPKKHILLIGR